MAEENIRQRHPAPRAEVRPAAALLAALALVALAYSSSLSGAFVWDDHALIEEAPQVRQLQPLGSYFQRSFWDGGQEARLWAPVSFYRPLTTLSYALEHTLWEDAASGYRTTNLLLHLLVCTLLFALCRRSGASASTAALAAALFGLFPRLTESVAWISGRTDVLASVGVLAALLVHDAAPGRTGRRLAASGLLLAAALCKEVALAGAGALAVMELGERRTDGGTWRRTAWHLAPLAVALGAYLALALPSLAAQGGAGAWSLPQRLGLAFQALGTYGLMLLDPLRPRLEIGRLGSPAPLVALLGLAIFLGLGILGLRGRKLQAPVLCGAALAILALAPVLHLVPLPVRTLAADRYLYLPLAGLVLAVVGTVPRWTPRATRVVGPVALALLALLASATHLRAREWGDELTLWPTAVRHAPAESGFAQIQLAEVLARRGRFEEALGAYRNGFALDRAFQARHPDFPADRRILGNIAACLSELGRVDEAMTMLEDLVREQPDVALHRFNLGLNYAKRLQFGAAQIAVREALRLDPGYARAQQLLHDVTEAQARWEALPPETLGEPVAVRAERAAMLSRFGNLHDARRLWQEVAEAPAVPDALLERATRFLVARGDLSAAQRAVTRLKHEAPGSNGPLLERALAERRLEATP